MTSRGGGQARKEEIVALAKVHGILTPYTAFLAR
jgi:hypothetical protein